MPKIANAKVKLLFIADYIVRKSDEDHGFYIKDIKEYLESKGIKAEYHSITDDIKLLRDQFGMDIEGGGGRPFYLLSHFFPFEDISVISECVGSAKFLSEKDAKRLTDTLKGLCSEYQAETIDSDYFVVERPRQTQENMLEALGLIRDAIKQNQKISFKYTTRSLKGFSKTYKRKGEDYKVSPFEVVLSEGNHYLIGYDAKYRKLMSYRISRMESLNYVNEPRDGEEKYSRRSISDYARQTFGLFIGPEAKRITLLCDNDLLDVMVERFGTARNVEYKKVDDKHFSLTTAIVASPVFFGWVCGFAGKVVIQDDGKEDNIVKEFLEQLEKVKRKQEESKE